MLQFPARLVAPALTFHNNPRAARLAHEHRRLQISLDNLVRTRSKTMALGGDPLLKQLVSAAGFKPEDLVVLRVIVRTRAATLICIPNRVWRDPVSREQLLALKRDAKRLGTTCVLIPQSCVRGNTRASNARLMAVAQNVSCTDHHRALATDHLRRVRLCTIKECAELFTEHDDPIGLVLHMCADGTIAVDRRDKITAMSWVSTLLH